MNFDREEKPLAIVAASCIVLIVTLCMLAITGILYSGMDKRYKAINARIDTVQQGITTFHVWNFETRQMDVYIAAGINNTTALPDSPVIPVYVTQSFFEKGLYKIQQRSVQLKESNKATKLK